jgi:hypothetical protein
MLLLCDRDASPRRADADLHLYLLAITMRPAPRGK